MQTTEQKQGFGSFGAPLSVYTPSCSLAENATHYIAMLDIPGVKKTDLEVYVQGYSLIIRGVRQWEEKESRQWQWTHNERPFGQFVREIMIPGVIDADNIEAKLEHGQLAVLLPKKGTDSSPYKEVKVSNGSGNTSKN